MVQFTLPANSKIGKGKIHKAAVGAARMRRFRVYRWNPADGKRPQIDIFEIDIDHCGPMVLEIGRAHV